tara:strand:- start:25 stop:543 length:519 start_codon:yes stop_codon:yes gene_type:complete
MKSKSAELLKLFRQFGRINTDSREELRQKTKSTRHPLGLRMFRGKMQIWPKERRQMSHVVELREAGKTWDEVYFTFLRERRRNLRNGREISRGRLQNMYTAEIEFREQEALEIARQLVEWADAGNSLTQIRYAALKKGLWSDADEITLEQIQEIIDHERQLQQMEQSHATQQ